MKPEEVVLLSGPALDLAVAKALPGFSYWKASDVEYPDERPWVLDSDGVIRSYTEIDSRSMNRQYTSTVWSPSVNWSQGGPIIEHEKIRVVPFNKPRTGWWAGIYDRMGGAEGSTPLEAAMRCYVAMQLTAKA